MDDDTSSIDLARACLTYLNLNVFNAGPAQSAVYCSVRYGTYPLYEYCAQNWHYHWQSRWMHQETRNMLQHLFLPVSKGCFLSLLQNQFWHSYNYLYDTNIADINEKYTSILRLIETLTPLHYAAIINEVELCSWLLESGASVTQASDVGQPLHLAVLGHTAFYRVLCQRNAAQGPPPPPPSLLPSTGHYSKLINLLIEFGAEIEGDSGIWRQTAVQLAASFGAYKLVPLLKFGARVDGNTIRILQNSLQHSQADFSGTTQILELIDSKALDGDDLTAFWELHSMTNAKETSTSLAQDDSVLNRISCDRERHWLALQQAVRYGHTQTVKALLILRHADLNQTVDEKEVMRYNHKTGRQLAHGGTLLHMAVDHPQHDLTRCLLSFGANACASANDGTTPLHLSARDFTGSITRLLLENGADIGLTDTRGWNIWHFAAAYGNHRTLDIITNFDTDSRQSLTVRNINGRTPLDVLGTLISHTSHVPMDSQSFGDLDSCLLFCLKILLRLGSDTAALGTDGSTTLHYWLEYGMFSLPCIKVLIDRGLNVSATRTDGKTALHMLQAPESTDLFNLRRTLRLLLSETQQPITDKDGKLPIHEIYSKVCNMHIMLLDTFVSFGSHPTKKDGKGRCCFELVLLAAEAELQTVQVHWSMVSRCIKFFVDMLKYANDHLLNLYRFSSRIFDVACRFFEPQLINQILDRGFLVDTCESTSKFGSRSALQSALYYGSSLPIIQALLNHSALKPPYPDQGLLCLHCASTNDFSGSIPPVLKFLLDIGLDPNERTTIDCRTPLIHAAKTGKVFHVRYLIERGAYIDLCDSWGKNALHYACIHGNYQVVRLLCEHIDASGSRKDTHKSSSKAEKESTTAMALKSYNGLGSNSALLDVDARTNSGHTALYYAVVNSHLKCVELLLTKGATYSPQKSKSRSLLDIAAQNGNVEIVRLLLKHDEQNKMDQFLLLSSYYIATYEGHKLVAKLVLEAFTSSHGKFSLQFEGFRNLRQYLDHTVSQQKTGQLSNQKLAFLSAFSMAIRADDIDMCIGLFQFSVNLDLPIPHSCGGCKCSTCTPLLFAFQIESYAVARMLIEEGADIEQITRCSGPTRGYTPFHYAALFDCPNNIFTALLERQPLPALHTFPIHPAHIAVVGFRNDLLARLLDSLLIPNPGHVADFPIATDNLNWKWSLDGNEQNFTSDDISGTALHIAAYMDNDSAAEILIRYGANVNATDEDSDTPLHIAAANRSFDVLEVLISNEANPNARNRRLQTPLMLAFASNQRNIVSSLIQSGADATIVDRKGRNSFWYALISGQPSTLLSFDKDRGVLRTFSSQGASYVNIIFKTSRFMVTYFLNEDYDLTPFTTEQGGVFQAMSLDKLGGLKRMIRRLPSEVVNYLMELRGQKWNSALYIACTEGPIENVMWLLEAGAILDNEGGPCGTSLMGACNAGYLKAVKILIRRGAALTYKDGYSKQVSGLLAAKHHPKVMRWLLVDRYVEQKRIEFEIEGDAQKRKINFWSGPHTVKHHVPRPNNVSQLQHLIELCNIRKRSLGKVYSPYMCF